MKIIYILIRNTIIGFNLYLTKYLFTPKKFIYLASTVLFFEKTLTGENRYTQQNIDQLDIFQNNEHIVQSSIGPPGLYNVIKDEVAGISERARLYPEPCLIRRDDIKFNNQNVQWVDSTFFDVFKLKFLAGNPQNALSKVHSAILSKSSANRFFGNTDPIGEMIFVNEGMPFMVTGVIEDIPVDSHLKAEVFLTIKTFVVSRPSRWSNLRPRTRCMPSARKYPGVM